MFKFFIFVAAILGLAGVGAGAIGAHLIKAELNAIEAASFDTAVLYLFVHVLALLVVALILKLVSQHWLIKIAGVAFLFGILLFSGSILLRLSLAVSFSMPLAPAGGILLMVGWLALSLGGLNIK